MNRMQFTAVALAALLVGGNAAQAACKLSHIANKTWIMSATDANPVSRSLVYCKFTTSAAGTVAFAPNACVSHVGGTEMDFSAPFAFDIISATLKQHPAVSCGFDLDMSLVVPEGQNLKARVVMEAGKTMATGNWVSNFGSYGTISLMRQ